MTVLSTIPEHIRALAELSPVEDLLLAVLRDGLQGIEVKTLISADQGFPFVLVRRSPQLGQWDADTRFTDSAYCAVHAFCNGINADKDAAILSEAARVVLRDAWLGNKVVPGRGHLTKVEMTSAPRRVSDWATAAGPVQYADLPTGVERYETLYQISIRKPLDLEL